MAANEAYTTPAGGKRVKIAIEPLTRIEGHLKVEVLVEGGQVVDAWCSSGMFRGIENILQGREPRDATQISQRICGVCPTSHANASARALEEAFGLKGQIPTNGRIVRNLILGANFLQSHILHFYHLAALDYVKGPDTAPFVPRYANPDLRLSEGLNALGVDQYLKALEVRSICHQMAAIFCGRMPHAQGIVAGGTTQMPTRETIAAYQSRFEKVFDFIEKEYLPTVYLIGKVYLDLFKTGAGCRNMLCSGGFPQKDDESEWVFKPAVYTDGEDQPFDELRIKEYVKYAWYNSPSGLNPRHGATSADPRKAEAYSFSKAPRYNEKPHEVGPLARLWVNDLPLSPVGIKALSEQYSLKAKTFRDLGDLAFSIMGRHVARVEEAWLIAKNIRQWLGELKPEEETCLQTEDPAEGEGLGLTEAPRGSLLHYVNIKDKRIANYQIIPATEWHTCPRDDAGTLGPTEQALVGLPVPDVKNPVNVGRLIRAFDP